MSVQSQWQKKKFLKRPFVLNICVNDLSEMTDEWFIVQHAVDSQYLENGSIGNLSELIKRSEQSISNTKQYFKMSGLLLNSKKTQWIFIVGRALSSNIPRDTAVKVADTLNSPSLSLKNFGAFFDRYIFFDEHITEMSRKVSGIPMFISRIQNFLNKKLD